MACQSFDGICHQSQMCLSNTINQNHFKQNHLILLSKGPKLSDLCDLYPSPLMGKTHQCFPSQPNSQRSMEEAGSTPLALLTAYQSMMLWWQEGFCRKIATASVIYWWFSAVLGDCFCWWSLPFIAFRYVYVYFNKSSTIYFWNLSISPNFGVVKNH